MFTDICLDTWLYLDFTRVLSKHGLVFNLYSVHCVKYIEGWVVLCLYRGFISKRVARVLSRHMLHSRDNLTSQDTRFYP